MDRHRGGRDVAVLVDGSVPVTAASAFLRRHPASLALLLVGAVFIGSLQLVSREAAARRNELCQQFNRQEAVIRQLVQVATEPSGATTDLTTLTNLPQFKALDRNDQAFWLIVLRATSGGGQSTTQQRLIDFAHTHLQPADCSGT